MASLRQILTTISGGKIGLDALGALVINRRDGQQVVVDGVKLVTASRALTAADNGCTLECTTTLTLTINANTLPSCFACNVLPSGTTSTASDGTALLNGATTTVTRAAASNAAFAIIGRLSAADSFVVTGS